MGIVTGTTGNQAYRTRELYRQHASIDRRRRLPYRARLAFLAAGLFLTLTACGQGFSTDASTSGLNLSDREVIFSVQDWLATRSFERLVGAQQADRLVSDEVGYKDYNCYNSISIDHGANWQVEENGSRYKVTAQLSNLWRGHDSLSWDYFPQTGEVRSTHNASFC